MGCPTLIWLGRVARAQDTGWRITLDGFDDEREREMTGVELLAFVTAFKPGATGGGGGGGGAGAELSFFELMAYVALAGGRPRFLLIFFFFLMFLFTPADPDATLVL